VQTSGAMAGPRLFLRWPLELRRPSELHEMTGLVRTMSVLSYEDSGPVTSPPLVYRVGAAAIIATGFGASALWAWFLGCQLIRLVELVI